MNFSISKTNKREIICINPFIAMVFSFNGNTWGCMCPEWPKYSIGNIKQSSIAEIWNSDAARSIRRKMYEGRWQDICKPTCPIIADYLRYNKLIKYGELEKNKLLTPEAAEEIKAKKDYLKSPPVYFQPDISTDCNLHCIMCGRKQCKKDPAVQKKLWNDLKNYLPTAKEICITGMGEALARSDTRELLINYRGPAKFRLLTNGLLLPKYWEKIKHQNFAWLSISTDAATKTTYEKIRRGGRWEDLLKTFELVRQNKDKFGYIQLNMTVMRSNYREIPRFIDLAESYGFHCFFQSIQGEWGEENIFKFRDSITLDELENIVMNEASKRRSINIHWGDLLAHLDIPSDINLYSS